MFNEYDDRWIENIITSILSFIIFILVIPGFFPKPIIKVNGELIENPQRKPYDIMLIMFGVITLILYCLAKADHINIYSSNILRIMFKFLIGFYNVVFFVITIWQIFTLGSSSATAGGGISKSDTKSLKHTLNLRTNAKIQGREVDAEMHTNTATHQVLNTISSNSNNIEVKSTCNTMGHNVDLCTNARVQGRSLDAHIMENIVTNNAIDLLKK